MRNIFDNPLLLIVLLLIIVLVFGAKRLPDAARSVGRSMRIFKSEVKEMKDDDAPGAGRAAGSSAPLEGRVVPGDQRARDPQGHHPGSHDRADHDPADHDRADHDRADHDRADQDPQGREPRRGA